MTAGFAAPDAATLPLHILGPEAVEDWASDQPAPVQTQLKTQPFKGKLAEVRVLIDPTGAPLTALVGWGDAAQRARQQFPLGGVSAKLPEGAWHIETHPAEADLDNIALSWLLAAYRFDRYKAQSAPKALLATPRPEAAEGLMVRATAVALTSDLINTPANDMGPNALEAAALDLARAHGAEVTVLRGEELLQQNFPLIHTV
ncbi:MAG: leucyl aminopeptidase family protein, partial [Pseudomonadota bacterium]